MVVPVFITLVHKLFQYGRYPKTFAQCRRVFSRSFIRNPHILHGAVIVIIIVFLLLRPVYLWYWKVDESLDLLREQKRLLKKIAGEGEVPRSKEGMDWACPKCNTSNKNTSFHLLKLRLLIEVTRSKPVPLTPLPVQLAFAVSNIAWSACRCSGF